MQRLGRTSGRSRSMLLIVVAAMAVAWVSVIASRADLPGEAVTQEQVARGRLVVVSHDCGGCHSSGANGSNRFGASEPGGERAIAEGFAGRDRGQGLPHAALKICAGGAPFDVGEAAEFAFEIAAQQAFEACRRGTRFWHHRSVVQA